MMNTINQLLDELDRHKVRYVPTNDRERYLKHLFDYYTRYCEIKGFTPLEEYKNVIQSCMRVHLKIDLEQARLHYDKSNRFYFIWIPPYDSLDLFIKQQMISEENVE